MFQNQYSVRRVGVDEVLTRALVVSVAGLLAVCLSSWVDESAPNAAQQLAQTPAATQSVVVSQLEPVRP